MKDFDLEKRGYRIPENYFEDFPSTLPIRNRKRSLQAGRLAAASVLLLLLTLGAIVYFYQKNTSPETELTWEERLCYDDSFDFEDELATLLQENEIEVNYFDGIDANELEEYLNTDFSGEDI